MRQRVSESASPGLGGQAEGGLRVQTAAEPRVEEPAGGGPGKNRRGRGPGPTFFCDSGLTQCHFGTASEAGGRCFFAKRQNNSLLGAARPELRAAGNHPRSPAGGGVTERPGPRAFPLPGARRARAGGAAFPRPGQSAPTGKRLQGELKREGAAAGAPPPPPGKGFPPPAPPPAPAPCWEEPGIGPAECGSGDSLQLPPAARPAGAGKGSPRRIWWAVEGLRRMGRQQPQRPQEPRDSDWPGSRGRCWLRGGRRAQPPHLAPQSAPEGGPEPPSPPSRLRPARAVLSRSLLSPDPEPERSPGKSGTFKLHLESCSSPGDLPVSDHPDVSL